MTFNNASTKTDQSKVLLNRPTGSLGIKDTPHEVRAKIPETNFFYSAIPTHTRSIGHKSNFYKDYGRKTLFAALSRSKSIPVGSNGWRTTTAHPSGR